MTVSAVTIPTPPNSNLSRAMFCWNGTVGSTQDSLSTATKMQNLLNWCSTYGVNTLFLDMWGYLGGANWSAAHAQTMQEFIHFAHASGIRVLALSGNTNWPSDQQWVLANIIKPVLQYNAYCVNNSTYPDAMFDGFMFDIEYWTQAGYAVSAPIGLCDLITAVKRMAPNLQVGCTTTWWLANSGSAALSFSYAGGPSQLEGLNIMDVCDLVVVQCYSNSAAPTGNTQVTQFQPWFTYGSQTGLGLNCGLMCASLTDSGQAAGTSYWTGASGAIATMETNHTTISTTFTASPNTNCCFLGQAIEEYNLAGADSYMNMT